MAGARSFCERQREAPEFVLDLITCVHLSARNRYAERYEYADAGAELIYNATSATYLPTYLRTYLRTYLPSHLLTYLLTYTKPTLCVCAAYLALPARRPTLTQQPVLFGRGFGEQA